VPCAIRETFISVPEITLYSICFILSYEMRSDTPATTCPKAMLSHQICPKG
jgi:hypothetical protein